MADRAPERLRALLSLEAFPPQKVRTPQGGFHPDEFGPLKPGEWGIPLTEGVVDAIGRDVNAQDRKRMMTKARPWPAKHSSDPVTLSESFDSVKSAHIFCTGGGDSVDDILKGKWGKIGGPYRVIESGHWPMVTRPEELVDDFL